MSEDNQRNLLGFLLKKADTFFPFSEDPFNEVKESPLVKKLISLIYGEEDQEEKVTKIYLNTEEILSITTQRLICADIGNAIASVKAMSRNQEVDFESEEFSFLADQCRVFLLENLPWTQGVTTEMVPVQGIGESQEFYDGYLKCWSDFISVNVNDESSFHEIDISNFKPEYKAVEEDTTDGFIDLENDEEVSEFMENFVSLINNGLAEGVSTGPCTCDE